MSNSVEAGKGADPRKAAKCYFGTAMKEFRVSKKQLEEAIELGVLTVEYVKNPHHRSTSSKLLHRYEIEKNLQLIKKLRRLRKRGIVYDVTWWGNRDRLGYPPLTWHVRSDIGSDRFSDAYVVERLINRQLIAQGQLQFIMDATGCDEYKASTLLQEYVCKYAEMAVEISRDLKEGSLNPRELTKARKTNMFVSAIFNLNHISPAIGKIMDDFEVTVAATTAEEAEAQDEKELAAWKEQFTEFQAQKKKLQEDLNVIAQVLRENIRFLRFSRPTRRFNVNVWKNERVYVNLYDLSGHETGTATITLEPRRRRYKLTMPPNCKPATIRELNRAFKLALAKLRSLRKSRASKSKRHATRPGRISKTTSAFTAAKKDSWTKGAED